MRLNWRQVYVGLFAIQIILVAYLLFTYLGGRSRITIEKPRTSQSQTATDSNEIGRLGALGVGTVEKARFVNFSEDRQSSREFGFEELLHKSGDRWEISKPFLNLYQRDFECRVTAELGLVLADNLEEATDIKEATLKNNVVVHIVHKDRLGPEQVDIYLDDIVFISYRSMFLTAGPVKVLGKDIQLLGRGLELVYNYAEDRLELFRIIDLESLCLNRLRSTGARQVDGTSPAVPDDEPESAGAADRYRAVLNTNVIVHSAGQVLTADDNLTIQNIIRRKGPVVQGLDAETVKPDSLENLPADRPLDVVITCHQGLVVYPMDVPVPQAALLTAVSAAPAAAQSNPDLITEHSNVNSLRTKTVNYDAVTGQAVAAGPAKLTYHTVDYEGRGGSMTVTITAEEKLTYHPDSRRVIFEGSCLATFVGSDFENQRQYTIAAPKITAVLAAERSGAEPVYIKHIAAEGGVTAVAYDVQADRNTAQFIAPRIDYFADGGSIIATGQSELTLWNRQAGASGEAQPVRITAKETVHFSPALNTILFEGDCFCETVRQGNAVQPRKYTLEAQSITVELQKEQQSVSALSAAGVKKVLASNNAVITVISLSDRSKIAEFTANEIVYDSANENISAAGLSRLLYFSRDIGQPDSIRDTPVAITARDSALFSMASNQALFRGDCVCTMIRTDTGVPRKYRLTAPQVAVDIASSNGSLSGSAGIEYLTAGDNAVIVVTPVNSIAELARFTASRVKYHTMADSITANGPCDFTFYANDFMPTKTLGAAVPVQIYAEKKTTFLPARNQLAFEGDCICTMVRSRPDSQNKYTLSAPRITIDLSRQEEQDLAASALGIEKFTADGGLVQISSVKTVSDRLVTFNKIKCRRFVYDTGEKLFTAAGPGIITVDNSNIDQSQSVQGLAQDRSEGFGITKKCYAFLRDFKTLRFNLRTNRILARNDESKMLADYFPIVDGQDTRQIKASAGAIEIELASNTGGGDEISALRAYEGITYEDDDNQFMADQMFYDAQTSLIKAKGSDFHRCYLNGAIVDNIVYDLNRRAVINVDVTEPGRAQVLK